MKSKIKLRRLLALVLTFAMLFTTVPFAFAEEGEEYTAQMLLDAIAAVEEGGTVTLGGDVTVGTTIETTKTFTLDLNEYTLTSTAKCALTVTSGTLTIENGVLIGENNGIRFTKDSAGAGIVLDNEAAVGGKNGYGVFVCGSSDAENKNTLTVYNGATVGAIGNAAITTNGLYPNAEIIIEDGEIVSMSDEAIYLPAGKLTISGGYFSGTSALYVKGGEVKIYNGYFYGFGEAKEFVHSGNGSNPTGDALVIENSDYPSAGDNLKVTVNGGYFESENAKAVASYTTDEETYPAKVNFINGGKFSSDVKELFDGYTWTSKATVIDNEYHQFTGTKPGVGKAVITIPHEYGEVTTVKEVTCTEDGKGKKSCASCGKDTMVVIEKTGHSLVDIPEKAATCVEDGNKACKKCSNCNKYFDASENELSENDVIITATGHDLDNENYGEKAATETEHGYIKHGCNTCFDIVEVPTHNIVPVEETATTIAHYKCTVCDKLFSDSEGANEINDIAKEESHDWQWVIDEAATCTTAGKQHQECAHCNGVQAENTVIPALGHAMSEEIVVAPTCGTAGYTKKECTREGCDYAEKIEGTEVPATGEHENFTGVVVDPTCEKDGYTRYTCKECGLYSYNAEFTPKLGHSPAKKVVAATCTDRGYTETTCRRCDMEPIKDNWTDALGHAWVETADPSNRAATCTAEGQQKYTCSRCDTSEIKTLERLGHDWTEWESLDGKTPNCTQSGAMRRTCKRSGCLASEINEFDELGHDWKGLTRLNGMWVATCGRCNKELNEKIDESKYKTIEDRGISLTYYDDPVYNIRTFDADGPLTLRVIDAPTRSVYIDKYVNKDYETRAAYDIRVFDVYGNELDAKGECTLRIPLGAGFNVNDTRVYIIDDGKYIDPVYGGVETDGKGALMFEPHRFGTYLLVNESTKSAADDCECIHHSDNWFLKIVYKFLCFFWKLFKINRECECGELHY